MVSARKKKGRGAAAVHARHTTGPLEMKSREGRPCVLPCTAPLFLAPFPDPKSIKPGLEALRCR